MKRTGQKLSHRLSSTCFLLLLMGLGGVQGPISGRSLEMQENALESSPGEWRSIGEDTRIYLPVHTHISGLMMLMMSDRRV